MLEIHALTSQCVRTYTTGVVGDLVLNVEAGGQTAPIPATVARYG